MWFSYIIAKHSPAPPDPLFCSSHPVGILDRQMRLYFFLFAAFTSFLSHINKRGLQKMICWPALLADLWMIFSELIKPGLHAHILTNNILKWGYNKRLFSLSVHLLINRLIVWSRNYQKIVTPMWHPQIACFVQSTLPSPKIFSSLS